MPCPHCASPRTARQTKTTALGYQAFRCAACRHSVTSGLVHRAIRTTLGRRVTHRRNRSLNHRLEQDHRPQRGFESFGGAARFCTAHDELGDSFRCRQRPSATVSLAEQRRMSCDCWAVLLALLAA